jgi:hypothetical protein
VSIRLVLWFAHCILQFPLDSYLLLWLDLALKYLPQPRFGTTLPTMSHQEVVRLFLEIAGTIHGPVNIIKLCETEADNVTPSMPYCLRTNWREIVAKRIIEDILYDRPHKAALTEILFTHEEFTLLCRVKNGADDNCTCQSTFHCLLSSTIASNCNFRVMVQLLSKAMTDLKLQPWQNMAIPNQLCYLAPHSPVGNSDFMLDPPPASNKLDIHQDLELQQFHPTDL